MRLPGKKPIFSIGDWPVYSTPSVRYSFIGLVVVLTIVAIVLTDLTPLDSLIAGLLMTLIHLIGELVHQYGHKLAADFTGYPSTGTTLWFILAGTNYPSNEGKLPSKVHIQRALGGPILSSLFLLLFFILAQWMWPMGGMAQLLIGFAIFEQITIYTLGALLPIHLSKLNFQSDGSILLRELRKR